MARTGRKPTFLWQGILLMLPVTVLAVIGLVSLRRDEQSAEEDARRRAVENARSLARTIRSAADDDLRQFLALQTLWELEARLAGQASVAHTNVSGGSALPSEKLRADVSRFEQAYPRLKLAELVVAQGSLLCDGRQVMPHEVPISPEPPKWYTGLTPRQRELWQALRNAESGSAGSQAVESARQEFLETNPGDDARQAAACLQQPPEQLLSSRPLASESGISFQDLACYRLLHESNGPITSPLLDAVWRQVIERPSFVSPTLLELAEGLTNRAGLLFEDEVRWLRRYWQSQSRARAWVAPLHGLPALTNWNPQGIHACWTRAESGDALVFFEPATFKDMGADSEGDLLSGLGYNVYFVPRPVVEAIFAKALAENRFLVPEYALVTVSVGGTPLSLRSAPPHPDPLPPGEGERSAVVAPMGVNGEQTPDSTASTSSRSYPPLASASERLGKWPVPDTALFEVQFHLSSRDQMLAAERRRVRLFGGLILGSAFVALVGLLAARRSFHRQLRLSELKSNFVSSVSHELRAPIASVRLMAESLERGKIPDTTKQQEYFRFIVQECRRLSSLIANVLDFSRIEQGRKQYEFEPTDLLALTQQTVALMQTYAAERQVKLVCTVNGCQPSAINYQLSVDGKAIQQALINLIDNALKHSPKGETVTVGLDAKFKGRNPTRCDSSTAGREAERSPKSEVRSPKADDKAPPASPIVLPASSFPHPASSPTQRAPVAPKSDEGGTRDTQPAIALWVEDHGPGIPFSEHEKIFERFCRLGSELRRETPGVGIGLSIVKHIVEAHNGHVQLDSALGKGSRFTIELPFEPWNES
jgi:signal transduction histidine kinase